MDCPDKDNKILKLTLADLRKNYGDRSTKASEIVRQLGFAAIALIWVFKFGGPSSTQIESGLLRGAFFVVVALTLDFVQYLAATGLWFWFFLKKEIESHNSPDFTDNFEAPDWINKPTWIIFWAKAACILIAYLGFILPFLAHKFVGN